MDLRKSGISSFEQYAINASPLLRRYTTKFPSICSHSNLVILTEIEDNLMGRKKNQAYTEEFRKEAVKRSEKQGITQAMVAEELGVSAQQIANWKRQFTRLSDKQFNSLDGVDYSKKESEALRKLRRENKRLQEEMAFLKKAAAYFAKNQE